MTFREQLELYKKGKLSPAERAQLEEFIDRQEAIGDYLADRDWEKSEEIMGRAAEEAMGRASDEALGRAAEKAMGRAADAASPEAVATPTGLSASAVALADDFERKLARRIRMSFVKAGLITAATVLVLLLLGAVILPRLGDCLFYDPLEKPAQTPTTEETEAPNVLSADLAAFTEVFRPDYYRTYATAERLGYGEYEIVIYNLNGRERTVGTLRRNRLLLYDGTVLNALSGQFERENEPGAGVCYVRFMEGTSYTDVLNLWAQLGLPADEVWVCVSCEDSLGDAGFWASSEGKLRTAEEAEAHWRELTEYLADREEFLMLTSVTSAEVEALCAASPAEIKGVRVNLSEEQTVKLSGCKRVTGIYTETK